MSQHQNEQEDVVRPDLSETRKAQAKQAIGKDAESIELSAQELEERISPRTNLLA